MRRAGIVAVTLVTLVTAVTLVIAVVATSGDSDDAGGRAPASAAIPDSWRIEYEVVTGGTRVIDVVTVRRPFESRVETTAPDSDDQVSSQVGSFARLRQESPTGEPLVVAVPPGPAPSDVRLDVVIPDAVARGLLVRREEREVAGRRCRVYRSGALLTSGPMVPPSPEEFADSCVDDAGLVLEEELVVEGEAVLRRTATRVDLSPAVDAGAFVTGTPTIPASAGGGSVLPLAPGTGRPGPFWVLEDPPRGFRPCGRFSVVPVAPAEELGVDRRVASVAQVFVRGRDVLVVDQGATLDGGSPFELGAGEAVDLGDLGEGEVVLGSQASEVRTVLDAGGYVRVVATLPPDDIVAVARRLTVVPDGGELQVVQDEEPACRP